MNARWLLRAAGSAEPQKDQPSDLTIGGIEARLFYTYSGRMSDDILDQPKPFWGHNTVIEKLSQLLVSYDDGERL